jgi:xylulokinase
MTSVLTFDLGTTYFKVGLFDRAFGLTALERVAVPVEHPLPGHDELPVEKFRDSVAKAVRNVAQQAGGLRAVEKICFASQANTFTLFDANDRPLLPFLLWSDQRARNSDGALQSLTRHPDFYAKTGVPQLDYQFMPAKLRWLQQHRPKVVEGTRRLCGIGDYLVWWLTGNHLAEGGLVGLSGIVDIHQMDYWEHALQAIDLPRSWLPPIVRAGCDAGQVRGDIAKDWGLSPECRVTMGCLDQYAGAIGAGNNEPGGVSETTGTVLATIRCASKFFSHPAAGVFQGPAFKIGTYYQMVFSTISAGILERYRDRLNDRVTFSELDELAAAVPFGAEGLRLRPDAATAISDDLFVGRRKAHHRGHEVRAILEGVAYELRRQVSALCGKEWPDRIKAAGGAARSKLWLKIKSQILGCSVESVDCLEPTSLGAARLAL